MKIIKKNLKFIIVAFICVCSSALSTYAGTAIFAASEVSYNNSNSGIQSDSLKGAIDELYSCAKTYSDYETRLTTFENNYKKNVFPIGSIYVSANDSTAEDVAARFGGTWVAYAAGKTMVGYKANDDNFDNIGNTGGAYYATLAAENIPAHTHTYAKVTGAASHVLTAAEFPPHTHTLTGIATTSTAGSATLSLQGDSNWVLYKANLSHTNANSLWSIGSKTTAKKTGYYTVVIGKDSDSSSTSAVGNSTGHTHTITTTSANTTSVGKSSPDRFSVSDAYITVYFWRRTA